MRRLLGTLLTLLPWIAGSAAAAEPPAVSVERGRYLAHGVCAS